MYGKDLHMSKICRTFAPEFEKLKIMKKMYKKPIVEQAEMLTGSIVMAGSPGGLPVGDPVPGEGGD